MPTPALIRPDPFRGDFGPFVATEAVGGSATVVIALERFAPQPALVQVANRALRICRHLDTPLSFARQVRGGRLGAEFIAPGQHFVFEAQAEARFSWPAPFRVLSLTIDAAVFLTVGEAPPAEAVRVRAHDPVLDRLTSLALLEAEEGFPRGSLFAEGLGLAAAAHLAACRSLGRLDPSPGQGEVLGPARLRRLREAVEATLPGRPTLLDLAATVDVPAHRLGAAFRRATGTSLWDYVAERRVVLAEALLADARLSLAAVAAHAGYSSQAHMTTAFRRQRGITPAAWRRLRRA